MGLIYRPAGNPDEIVVWDIELEAFDECINRWLIPGV